MTPSWRPLLSRLFGRPNHAPRSGVKPSFRPQVEELEDRYLLANAPLLVTNTNDAGAGSLRQAIAAANAAPGLDTITFNIPGKGVHIIHLESTLDIVDPVIIDAYSQAGATLNLLANSDNATIKVVLVSPAAKPALNSRSMFGEPTTHLLIRPGPFKGVGIAMVIFWP